MKKLLVFLCVAALLFGTCACAAKKETTAKEATTGEVVTKNTVDKDVAVSDSLSELISTLVVEQEKGNYKACDRFEEAHEILGAKEGDMQGNKTDTCITVYFFSLFEGFIQVEEAYETSSLGCHPSAMVLEKQGEEYVLVQYWAPETNETMEASAKAVFPEDLFNKLPFETQQSNALIEKLQAEIQAKLAQ